MTPRADEALTAADRDSAHALAKAVAEWPLTELDAELSVAAASASDRAYAISISCLLAGHRDEAALARAVSRTLDFALAGQVVAEYAILTSRTSTETLAHRLDSLVGGAGTTLAGTPIAAATYELETLYPLPGSATTGVDVPIDALRSAKRDSSPATGEPRTPPERIVLITAPERLAEHMERRFGEHNADVSFEHVAAGRDAGPETVALLPARPRGMALSELIRQLRAPGEQAPTLCLLGADARDRATAASLRLDWFWELPATASAVKRILAGLPPE